MGRPVEELLTGKRAPLSVNEFQMWSTYYKVKQVKEKQGNH